MDTNTLTPVQAAQQQAKILYAALGRGHHAEYVHERHGTTKTDQWRDATAEAIRTEYAELQRLMALLDIES